MAWYLVSYDLRAEQTSDSYVSIFKALQSATDWCRPLFSAWIVETPRTPSEVISVLRHVGALDDDDGAIVLEITGRGDFRRVIDADVASWLNEHILRI